MLEPMLDQKLKILFFKRFFEFFRKSQSMGRLDRFGKIGRTRKYGTYGMSFRARCGHKGDCKSSRRCRFQKCAPR